MPQAGMPRGWLRDPLFYAHMLPGFVVLLYMAYVLWPS